MSRRRKPRFELVRGDSGWFARFRAANGRKVWQTEVYRREQGAVDAIDLMMRTCVMWQHGLGDCHSVDERGQ